MNDLTKSRVSEKWSEWGEEGVSFTRKCEEHSLRLVVVFNKSVLAYRPIFIFLTRVPWEKLIFFKEH